MGIRTKKNRFARILLEVFLWILSLTVLYPIALAVINSLKTSAEADLLSISLPQSFQFGNYVKVFEEANVLRAFGNGMLITGTAVLFCVLLSSMASYVLSRNRSKINRFLYYLLILGLIFNISMIPTIKIMQTLHLMNTLSGLILLEIATSVSFCIFIYHGFFPSIPTTIDEAAVIDGCNPLQVYFRVVFPLLKPVNATIIVTVFLSVWNEFQLPLYFMSDPKKWTLPMTIYNFCGRYASEWNLVFADVILTIIPVLIVYFLCQKYIIEGMTSGAVKG